MKNLRACLNVDNRRHQLAAHHAVCLLHLAGSSVIGVDCAKRNAVRGAVWLLVSATKLQSGDYNQRQVEKQCKRSTWPLELSPHVYTEFVMLDIAAV